MTLRRNKFYLLLLMACAVGYIWLYINISNTGFKPANGVCLFKNVTGIPCPSCGATRSVLALIHGNFQRAIAVNPLGIIISAVLLITPFWIFTDFIRQKQTLINFYKQTEILLRKPKIAFPLIFLVLINWIWNITKGL